MNKKINVINIKEKFNQFSEYWSPKIIGELNDSYIKLAKFKGNFTWHSHEHEDEMFLVVKGRLTIKLHDKDLLLEEGECCVIPKGVEHCPVADEEVHVMLLELKSVLNTGDKLTEQTVEKLDWI